MSTATLPPAASDLTPPDPTDPRIYPPLTDAQIERMRAFGEPREFAAGAVVFEQGQRESPFFFLDAGAVRIVERGPEGRQLVHVDAGTFIGDIAMFTGAPAAVACEAVGPVVAHVLDREKLRRLVTSHADIGDLVLRALLARRDWMRAQHVGEIKLLGPAWSDETHRLRTFLERNQVPFSWYDTEACTESCALTDALSITADDFPVIISGENVYRRPDIDGVANCLGLRPDLSEDEPYDLAVIGAGPGGLGAAVYGASEGLSTVVFEGDSPGGQAGTSSKIENYLGFVTGVSGQELTKQATLQARKFGAVMTNPTAVTGIVCDAADLPKRITLNDGRTIKAWAVVIASGASYRKLPDIGCERFEGKGVYYAAGPMEAQQCQTSQVVIVGGGNSAGQAAIFLSEHVEHVHLVIRRPDLSATMSDYLIGRIHTSPTITLHTETEVVGVSGDDRPRSFTFRSPAGEREVAAAALFVMIGASPRTEWIDPTICVALDAKGFVTTGPSAKGHPLFATHWSGSRDPHLLETTRPGVFAVGDVRSGSVKRVASAVGEGAMAVSFVHAFLSEPAVGAARAAARG